MALPHPELRVEVRKSGNKFFAVTKQENGQEICTNEFQHDPTGTTHLGPLWLLERGALSPDELSRSGAVAGGRATEEQVIVYGQRLYGYLFGKGKKLQAFLEANPAYRQAHLILSLHPDIASLWRLPWEYLHDGDDFVCLNGALRLSRLPEDLLPLSLPATPLPLRVLFVIAAPEDQKALDVERELTVAQDALEDHIRAGRLVMDVLDEASLPVLQDTLQRQPYHVLHYIGHGTYTYKQQRGFLCFEKCNGETELVSAEHLQPALSGAATLRLIVTAACQSAQIGVLDAFDNVAIELLQWGVPAVLTAPTSLTDDSAIEWLYTFYGKLAAGQSPIDSLYDARLALKQVDDERPAERRRFDWGVPALYMRAQDTPLMDPALKVQETSAPAPVRNIAGLALPHPFVDHSRELHTLRRARQEAVPVLSLWGSDGSGKSTLAAEFIAYAGVSTEDVLTIRCREWTEPVMALEKIAAFWRAHQTEAHDKAAAVLLDSRRDPTERARMAAQWVAGYPHMIVFDDLDAWFEAPAASDNSTPASIADKIMRPILQGLLDTHGSATYLCITQRRWAAVAAMPPAQKRELHITALTPRYAVLLMNMLPFLGQEPLTAKLDVYRLLGGHPETLKLLAGWLTAGHSLQDLRDNPPVAPQATEAWQQYFLAAILESLDPGESQAIITLAVGEEPFNSDQVTQWTPIVEKKYAASLLERGEKLALLQLQAIENGVAWYTFHPLVRQYILEKMDDDTRTALHMQMAAHYGAPFMDEARRRIVAHNITAWPEERIAWLARDSNGILGMWLRQTQNPEHSRRVMADALAWQYHLFQAGQYEAAAHIVRTLVPVLNRWGQHDLSAALLQRTIAASAGAERTPSMTDLATLYLDRGHLAEALAVYEEVYRMLEEQGAKEQMAHILRRIAGAYQQLGNSLQAIQKYEAALRLMREIGNKNGEGLCFYQLSALYRQVEDYRRALMCSQAAKELYSKLDNRAGMAAALYEQGVNLKRLEHPDQALEHLRQSLEIARDIEDTALTLNVLQEISALHRDNGQLDAAIEAARQAAELCQRVDVHKAVLALEYLGRLYEQCGDKDNAAASYEQARRLAPP